MITATISTRHRVHGRDVRQSAESAWPLRAADGRTFAEIHAGARRAMGESK